MADDKFVGVRETAAEYLVTPRDKGEWFEALIKRYLKEGPEYRDTIKNVWLWREWPHASPVRDIGIDLVAEDINGEYWAIQCKNYDAARQLVKQEVDSFFTTSGRTFKANGRVCKFSRRLIVTTTNRISSNLEEAITGQTIPVTLIRRKDLDDSLVDWESFTPSRPGTFRQHPQNGVRPHQREAINKIISGFKKHNRGKLIMACGTGKTFTTLRLMEEYTKKNGTILFLAPSLSLVSQALREWSVQKKDKFRAFVVCSDSSIGRRSKDNEDIAVSELSYPVTTDAGRLADNAGTRTIGMRTVIFATYHSIDVIAKAQKRGLGEFDLVICDEAHRTTGIDTAKKETSFFLKVHDNDKIKAKKRLYMTATPRIYTGASKDIAKDRKASLYSMDDEAIYGEEFYQLGFGEAAEKGLLSEYKVMIVAVDEAQMANVSNAYNHAYEMEDNKAITHDLATQIIGSWKGLSKSGVKAISEHGEESKIIEDDDRPLGRAVAFSFTIESSQQKSQVFHKMTEMARKETKSREVNKLLRCEVKHIDGTMNAATRTDAINWLKQDPGKKGCRIISNARCLSEGVDIPDLDAVIFFETRDSIVDIVQAVGRVMRKAKDKKYGYIILPVCIPSGEVKDYNAYINDDKQFKGIWKVLKALRAHDDRLVDEAVYREKVEVTDVSDKQDTDGNKEPSQMDLSLLPIGDISNAMYAVIPRKLGDMEYWRDWARGVADIAKELTVRINDTLKHKKERKAFDNFLEDLQQNINPQISEDDAVEMLTQQILTRPIFDALFEGYTFTSENHVSKAMQLVLDSMKGIGIDSEVQKLKLFYKNVKRKIKAAKSDKAKQEVIRRLYDTFFQTAFPKMAERLGIAYTPVPVVDFIINSVQAALKKHLNSSLNRSNVQILDPFTGTGTFITRLIQSKHINKKQLPHKFQKEINANEIVLLAYYIAAINIESAYYGRTQQHQEFKGIVLTDSFQMHENRDIVDTVILPENSKRVTKQKKTPIQVVMSNPPYSAGQKSQNDNNKNVKYPELDADIAQSYVENSSATYRNSLYDSYIRAIRLASNRIENKGIVAFVTNGSFIDSNSTDGLRKCLVEEFSHIYIFNLRGNQRTSGEISRKEGGKIFGSSSRTQVAISIMVKDPDHKGKARLYYHDIGDYLSREDKLDIITKYGDIDSIKWKRITPNTEGDWINQRDPAFDKFISIGDKKNKDTTEVIFDMYSCGIVSSRDAWAYNFSIDDVADNMQRMITNYNRERRKYHKACGDDAESNWPEVRDIVNSEPANISWSRSLERDVLKGKIHKFDAEKIVPSTYRPFCRSWLYFSRAFNEMVYQMPQLYPTPEHKNIVIAVTGIAAGKPFSSLITDRIPSFDMHDKGQCFPLYWYEQADKADNPDLFANKKADKHGYIRHHAISDWALNAFRKRYRDNTITRKDIFWYIYGILHSPEYRERFGDTLKRMLPRIPFASDFRAFSTAGQQLGQCHLNYETTKMHPVTIHRASLLKEDKNYEVSKMTFAKTRDKNNKLIADKTAIRYNDYITISDIPIETYNYIVNGKPAIEWIMERYTYNQDKDSQIINDANEWSDDPKYILNLLRRIITVSMETNRIVRDLPKIKGNASK